MPLQLTKGNRADINASQFKIGLGWDPSTSANDFDLDVSAIIIGDSGKVLFDGTSQGEKYIVYYNSEDRMLPINLSNNIFQIEQYDSIKYPNREEDYRVKTRPVSPNFEVVGSLDDKSGNVSEGDDDEDMFIDLSKVHIDAKEIIIIASIYEASERRQNFGQVRNAYIRVIDVFTNQEILKYELDEDFSTETAIEFGRIYKRGETWRFEAIGNGTSKGFEDYIKKYSSFIS
jgi:tellurium resistance protein TerD